MQTAGRTALHTRGWVLRCGRHDARRARRSGPSAGFATGGLKALARGLDFAKLAAAAELLGVIRGVTARALHHLRTREQFGVAIGTFQALRHRAVDLHLQQELVSAALDDACAAADAGAPDLPMRAARVKARASSAALLAAKEATQMHGAMGYTDECEVGLFLKRALALSAWLGNASELRALHARACLHPQSLPVAATA
ncbi:hypothetical protein HK414_22415 [Ramlibacter terrae]|uniref:Acyl-CoA dehydrogenase/oxidase C-terminal domain-containing protein n=1 Tax=Ramlibacter terrae TaxID=2732511 RepID=A0ABX6P745_9BURK|nr:hypothetical protein HK414_22415 [Ramlibacter terrae]